MAISSPSGVRHVTHVTFDRFKGFLGLPDDLDSRTPCNAHSTGPRVFGVSPESMPCDDDGRGNSVPRVLLLLQRSLYEQNGLETEGIFRVAAANEHEGRMREELNAGVLPPGIHVHALAGLIKAWFRELPEGVLDAIKPEVLAAAGGPEALVQLVEALVVPPQRALLAWVVELMADVAEREGMNKMSARNIAMVFAPNMTQVLDPLVGLKHAVKVMELLRLLIQRKQQQRREEEGPQPSPKDSNPLGRANSLPQTPIEYRGAPSQRSLGRDPVPEMPSGEAHASQGTARRGHPREGMQREGYAEGERWESTGQVCERTGQGRERTGEGKHMPFPFPQAAASPLPPPSPLFAPPGKGRVQSASNSRRARLRGSTVDADTTSDANSGTRSLAYSDTNTGTYSDTNSRPSSSTSTSGGGTGDSSYPRLKGGSGSEAETSGPHFQSHRYSPRAAKAGVRKEFRAGREQQGPPQKGSRGLEGEGSPISEEEYFDATTSPEPGTWRRSSTVPKLPGKCYSQAPTERISQGREEGSPSPPEQNLFKKSLTSPKLPGRKAYPRATSEKVPANLPLLRGSRKGALGPAPLGPVAIGPVALGPVAIGPVAIGPVPLGPVAIGPGMRRLVRAESDGERTMGPGARSKKSMLGPRLGLGAEEREGQGEGSRRRKDSAPGRQLLRTGSDGEGTLGAVRRASGGGASAGEDARARPSASVAAAAGVGVRGSTKVREEGGGVVPRGVDPRRGGGKATAPPCLNRPCSGARSPEPHSLHTQPRSRLERQSHSCPHPPTQPQSQRRSQTQSRSQSQSQPQSQPEPQSQWRPNTESQAREQAQVSGPPITHQPSPRGIPGADQLTKPQGKVPFLVASAEGYTTGYTGGHTDGYPSEYTAGVTEGYTSGGRVTGKWDTSVGRSGALGGQAGAATGRSNMDAKGSTSHYWKQEEGGGTGSGGEDRAGIGERPARRAVVVKGGSWKEGERAGSRGDEWAKAGATRRVSVKDHH